MDLETKIKISSDTSGLSKIAAESKKAFSPQSTKELKKTSKDLLDQFNLLAKAQLNLVKAMQGMERGSKAYKQLIRDLKDVKVQSDAVLAVLKNINQVTERTAQRRSSFVAGLGQGLGIAQYMPSGPGMLPRMAGAMVGGAARRTAGAAFNAFAMPGVSGFAGALSAIPVAGQALAGLIQGGYGYYQQAMQFSASRLPNVPYAGLRSMRTAGNPQYRALEQQLVDAYGRQMSAERTRAELKTGPAKKLSYLTPNLVLQPSTGMAVPAPGSTLIEPSKGNWVQRKFGAYGLMGEQKTFAGKALPPPEVTRQYAPSEAAGLLVKRGKLADAIYGPKIAEERTTIKSLTEKMRQTPAGIKMPDLGIPDAAFGVPFGFSPEETQQWFGSFMGARGGRSSAGLLHGGFRESMAVGRLYGVSPEQAGGFHRMQMPGGGGGVAGIGLVMEQIRSMGLQGSQATDYLQTMVEQGKRAEDRGLKVNIQGMTETGMFLRAAGLQGEQLGRVTGGITESYSNMAMTGVQTPAQVAMIRAAGWTPEQGTEGYFKTLAELEGGPGKKTLERLMGTVAQTAAAGRGPWEAGGLFARFFTQGVGTPMGPTMGKELMEQFKGGKLSQEGWEKYRKMMGQADIESGKVIPEAIRGASKVGGLAKAGYGLQAEQIGIGAGLSKFYMNLDRAGAQMIGAMGQFKDGLGDLSKIILMFAKNANKAAKAISEGGLMGFLSLALGGS